MRINLSRKLILCDEIAYSSPLDFSLKSLSKILILICFPESSLWKPKTLPFKISSLSFFFNSGFVLEKSTVVHLISPSRYSRKKFLI